MSTQQQRRDRVGLEPPHRQRLYLPVSRTWGGVKLTVTYRLRPPPPG